MGEKGDNAPSGPLSDILCLAHPFPIDTLKPICLCSYIKTIFFCFKFKGISLWNFIGMNLSVTKFNSSSLCVNLCVLGASSSFEAGSFISIEENNQLRVVCVSEFSKLLVKLSVSDFCVLDAVWSYGHS